MTTKRSCSAQACAYAGATVANRPNLGSKDIDELCALLESQNLAALDKFALLSASLSELVGTVRLGRLREAIDNLDFNWAPSCCARLCCPFVVVHDRMH
jgi:hypothetical protein